MDEHQCEVWLVHAKFNFMRFINDPWSVEGEVSGAASTAGEGMSANFIFDEKESAKIRTDYWRYNAVFTRPEGYITDGDELFIECGPSYIYPHWSSTIQRE